MKVKERLKKDAWACFKQKETKVRDKKKKGTYDFEQYALVIKDIIETSGET